MEIPILHHLEFIKHFKDIYIASWTCRLSNDVLYFSRHPELQNIFTKYRWKPDLQDRDSIPLQLHTPSFERRESPLCCGRCTNGREVAIQKKYRLDRLFVSNLVSRARRTLVLRHFELIHPSIFRTSAPSRTAALETSKDLLV